MGIVAGSRKLFQNIQSCVRLLASEERISSSRRGPISFCEESTFCEMMIGAPVDELLVVGLLCFGISSRILSEVLIESYIL